METAAKKKYVAKDPYELPALPDKANGARANDPRLATDEELKAFIDESGIDVDLDALDTTSAEFQTLPRDTQYDIVNDLRLRSRAPNYHRLQTMLSAARTPLDFSKAQILNLQKRNQLSQQMWSMAGIDTKAFTISVAGGRVAGERGKEYVLVKNDGAEGGWVLGIRDEGTSDKPIELDAEIKDVDARKLLEERDRLNKGSKRIEGGVLRSNKPLTVEDEEEKAEMERRYVAASASYTSVDADVCVLDFQIQSDCDGGSRTARTASKGSARGVRCSVLTQEGDEQEGRQAVRIVRACPSRRRCSSLRGRGRRGRHRDRQGRRTRRSAPGG